MTNRYGASMTNLYSLLPSTLTFLAAHMRYLCTRGSSNTSRSMRGSSLLRWNKSAMSLKGRIRRRRGLSCLQSAVSSYRNHERHYTANYNFRYESAWLGIKCWSTPVAQRTPTTTSAHGNYTALVFYKDGSGSKVVCRRGQLTISLSIPPHHHGRLASVSLYDLITCLCPRAYH